MKRLFLLFGIILVSLLSLVSCNKEYYDVVVTTYIGYDAVRAITKDSNLKCKMLLKPGSDIHSYEPSTMNLRSVLDCKLFVYVGGESDSQWVESDILGNVKSDNIKIVNMFDVLEGKLILEDNEEDEYDEHVWTNPDNYINIINDIKSKIIEIDNINRDLYEENTKEYIDKIKELDLKMKNVLSDSNKNVIVLADRNPFLYFGSYYEIDVIGALSGCSEDKNVPSSKIIELKNSVEENNLKAIFKLEYSDGDIAGSVKNEIDNDIKKGKYNGNSVSIETLYSMQKISSDDFNDGLTYIDFFSKNIEVIKKALS